MFAERPRFGLGLALVALLSAGGQALAQELAADQVLRLGNGAEPATLDPALAEATTDSNIQRDLFEGLTLLDAHNKIVPATAESWSLSPDGLVYTFKLRADAKWSDGSPVTAEDFVWSWQRMVDPATGSKYSFLYYPIKNAEDIATGHNKDVGSLGVKAIDAHTFEVTLKSPTGYFLSLIAHPRFLPVQKANVEKFHTQFTRPGNLVSNGAFMLKEWTPQSRIVLIKNPAYHSAAGVKLSEVDYFPIENQNEELKRYRAGELDVTAEVPSDQVDFIKQSMAGEFHTSPYLGTYYIGFNMTRAPFKDDPKLREAINLVIDREAIVEKVVKTGEIPAYSWVPPGLEGYQSQTVAWKSMPMVERIARAKQLYKEAGYGPDHPLTIDCRYNTSENHKKIMIAVASMIKQGLGAQCSLVNEEFKVFLETRKQKKLTELFRDGWIGDYSDPNTFAELLQSDSGLNDPGYSNPEYDKLVKQAAVTVDVEQRAALLEQAEKLMLQDLPMAPLYHYVKKEMIKPYVVGYTPNILGETYSKDIYLTKH
ncbi:MAG TPA: peptide ABC transporter substrate-binding protein [Aliidongia sp.]|nr:peptide ABC transporter substrate-binding protein [Aliidongia sp.]